MNSQLRPLFLPSLHRCAVSLRSSTSLYPHGGLAINRRPLLAHIPTSLRPLESRTRHTTAMDLTFPRFSDLAVEIRLMIWHQHFRDEALTPPTSLDREPRDLTPTGHSEPLVHRLWSYHRRARHVCTMPHCEKSFLRLEHLERHMDATYHPAVGRPQAQL